MEKTELLIKLSQQMQLLEFNLSNVEKFELSAYDISMRIRTLVHDTKKSVSLLQQLSLKNIRFYDTSSPVGSISNWHGNISIKGWDMNILPHIGIVGKHVEIIETRDLTIKYFPIFTRSQYKGHKTDFDDWWNTIVFDNRLGATLTRRQLVLNAANKDGGGHIDEPNSSYKLFNKSDVLRFRLNDIQKGATNIPVYSCIAQIGWEVYESIRDQTS
jgi:hypothetical protein